MMKTYEFKLYTSKKNKHIFAAIELAAEIYNHCIALHRAYYRLYNASLSANKLKKHITKLKRLPKYQHWNQLGSQAIQDVVERIDRSYNAFFSHVKKKRGGKKSPPHFCKRSRYKSFTLKQAGYKFHDDNHITIMGRDYKYVAHRKIEGTIKTVTIKRNALGEVFIYVVSDIASNQVLPRLGNVTGFDFGLKHFLTDSKGNTYDAPEFYKHNLTTLKKAQRRLSSKKKGSNNRKRALRHLERIHARISNRRKDWFYKLALQLISENAIICLEDLNLKAMQKLWGRKISDYAFGEFVRILEWECCKNGTTLVKINRWAPTTKACHHCGTITETLKLKDREWTCQVCQSRLDRDVNAAINIRELGIAAIS